MLIKGATGILSVEIFPYKQKNSISDRIIFSDNPSIWKDGNKYADVQYFLKSENYNF